MANKPSPGPPIIGANLPQLVDHLSWGTPGMADAATVFFRNQLKFDSSAPDWSDLDRFVLLSGHASRMLYSLLYLSRFADMSLDQLRRFRHLDPITAGHPEYGWSAPTERPGLDDARTLIAHRHRPNA